MIKERLKDNERFKKFTQILISYYPWKNVLLSDFHPKHVLLNDFHR